MSHMKGQVISVVCTPDDILECFLGGIDILRCGSKLSKKKGLKLTREQTVILGLRMVQRISEWLRENRIPNSPVELVVD